MIFDNKIDKNPCEHIYTPKIGSKIPIILSVEEVDKISRFDYLSGEVIEDLESYVIFPAKHFVADKEKTLKVIDEIRKELSERLSSIAAD